MYVEIQNIEHSMLKYRTQYVEIRIQNTGTELKRKEAFWVQCVELKFRMQNKGEEVKYGHMEALWVHGNMAERITWRVNRGKMCQRYRYVHV